MIRLSGQCVIYFCAKNAMIIVSLSIRWAITDKTVVLSSVCLTLFCCRFAANCCFVQQKVDRMAAGHIIKLTADFYTKDETLAARATVEKYVHHRLPRRQGSNAARATIEDLVKICFVFIQLSGCEKFYS